MTTESPSSTSPTPESGAGGFALTHWSVVPAAGRSDSTHTRSALEKLCRTYWQPIYAFVRRRGHSPHDAQDSTQEFFARLLENKSLADVEIADTVATPGEVEEEIRALFSALAT